jgi:hypothetical protein
MASQARGLQNFISDLRNAKSKVRIHRCLSWHCVRALSSRERVFIFIYSLVESSIYSEPPYLMCDIDVV